MSRGTCRHNVPSTHRTLSSSKHRSRKSRRSLPICIVRSATKPKPSPNYASEIQQRTNEATEAKEQLAQREAELEETRVQLSRQGSARIAGTPQDELATLLRIPNVKAVSLTGSDMAKRAAGFLLYDSQTQKVWLYSVNLPECPAGMTYQLWAIRDKPMSIGTFHMDTRRNRSPTGQEGAELHECKHLCRQP